MAEWIQRLSRGQNLTATVWISRPCQQHVELHRQFAQIREQAETYAPLVGREGIVAPGLFLRNEPNVEREWREMQRQLRHWREGQLAKTLPNLIRMLFARLKESAFHPVLLRRVCDAFSQLLEELRDADELSSDAEKKRQRTTSDQLCYSLQDIERWFLRDAEEVMTPSGLPESRSSKVRQVIRYIRKYGEELTTESIRSALVLS